MEDISYRDRIIQFDRQTLQEESKQLFIKMGGLDKDGRKFDLLRGMGSQIHKYIENRIDPKAVCSFYTADHIVKEGMFLRIDGVELKCNAFEQIDSDQIKGAYVYFIYAGDYYLEDEPIMNQLLADMWGTAFVDATRADFGRVLGQEANLSDEFGPGFFGMDVGQMNELAKLVDPSLIGVEIRETGVLLPLKSCGGLYLAVEDGYIPLDSACMDCKGTLKSCSYCNLKRRNRKMFKCTGICSKCGRCKDAGMMKGANDRKTKLLFLPDDFLPETDEQGYGIAFDIGTTTVVGMLWDIYSGTQVGAQAETNPQNEFGLDVISRITFAGENEGNLHLLHGKIINCLNQITDKLCKKFDVDKKAIIRATVCGNTTMSHLFAGYDPKSLARAPFSPAYTGTIFRKAGELGLQIQEDSTVMLFPNIAGHVGGDITAGILATRLEDRDGKTLFIDIGTNGEIVYCEGGKMLTCSTAAGPAFEGASIYQGMRAAVGAIEKIRIENEDVLFKVIGQVPPVGICGSGLIDAVSEMKKAGIINKTGRIASSEEYGRKHPGSLICERLRNGQAGREFVLVSMVNDDDIIITQNDVREVQLAKAAMAAGIQLMMQKMGSKPEELEQIIVAGAFGSYIDKDSAIGIGLLPNIDRKRILSAGNTAGAGALMAAASSKEALRVQRIPGKLEHIELANEPDFQTVYLNAMSFH
ncbi:MAG: ASKHA domain-containing protein [Clostridia bacterium]|nr:ASKHA domain-containing protein [Clostridia bacterium]